MKMTWMIVLAMLLGAAANAEQKVNISMVPPGPVEVGQPVFVDVYLGGVGDTQTFVGGTHIAFTWNAKALALVWYHGGVWANQGFWSDEFDDDWNKPCLGQPNPFDLCIPENDGTAVLTTIASFPPLVDGPESVYVGTLEFVALRTGDTHIQIHQELGDAVTAVAEMSGDPDVDKRVRGAVVRVTRR